MPGDAAASPSHRGGRLPWEIHGEDAALARDVTHSNSAPACFDPTAADRQAKAESRRVITAALRERPEQVFATPGTEPAAFVCDFDDNATRGRGRRDRHVRVRAGELEGILHEIRERRREKLSVSIDDDAELHRVDGEPDAVSIGIEGRSDSQLLNQLGDPHVFASLKG